MTSIKPINYFFPALCDNSKIIELLKKEWGNSYESVLKGLKSGDTEEQDKHVAYDLIINFVRDESEPVVEYVMGVNLTDDPAYIFPGYIMKFDSVFFIRITDGDDVEFFSSENEARQYFESMGYDLRESRNPLDG